MLMRIRLLPMALLAGSACLSAFPAEAQYRAPAGIQVTSRHSVRAPIPFSVEEKPSRASFIIVGAILGGATAGVWAYQDIKNSDAILGEIGVAIAAGAGLVAGGLIGWTVHSIRY